jgi:glycosyltransferase involved in cell wall biosynthesis
MPVPVSFLIPIRNERANLPRCLAAIEQWSDDILVVDSNSTDGSQAIAERYGARVFQFPFNGIWPKKKNWALETLPFRHEWVFILDADEVLPPETEAELAAIIALGDAAYQGYWINRRFMFLGQWLRHAYYPNWNLRFFQHRLGRYERLIQGATQSGDNEVHEHIIIQGKTGRLKSEMDHYAFPTIDVFVEKHNRYSNWEARLEVEGALQEADSAPQAWRIRFFRTLKRFSQQLPFRPTMRFLYVYLFQRGFLDGIPGYYFARLHGFYEFMSVAKAAELKRQRRGEPMTQIKK